MADKPGSNGPLGWTEGVDYKVDANDCWIWQRYVSKSGTPMQSCRESARRYAFRIAKRDPGKARVFALCGQPLCVRPSHAHSGSHSVVLNNSVASVAPPDVRAEMEIYIRCGMTARELAKKYGLTFHYARNVRAAIAKQLKSKRTP